MKYQELERPLGYLVGPAGPTTMPAGLLLFPPIKSLANLLLSTSKQPREATPSPKFQQKKFIARILFI
jgi:hypothetical protein